MPTSWPNTFLEDYRANCLEATCKNTKDKKLTWNSPHEFTEGQLCLASLIGFYNETDFVNNRGTGDVGFYKGFDTVSCIISVSQIVRYRLGKWMMRWVGNWPDCCFRAVLSGRKLNRQLVASDAP